MKARRFFSFSFREETGSMDNISSSCTWSLDKLDSPLQSLWLWTTLSESDKNMKAMMTLLEEGDVISIETDDICSRRKLELTKMLEDFNKSYRAQAEECDQLRPKSHHFLHSGSSSTPPYSRKMGHLSNNQKRTARSLDDTKFEPSDTQFESVVEDPNVECNSANFHFKYLNRLTDELMSTESMELINSGIGIGWFSYFFQSRTKRGCIS